MSIYIKVLTSSKKALDNLNVVTQVSSAKFIGGFVLENRGEEMVQIVIDAEFDTLENFYIHVKVLVDGLK